MQGFGERLQSGSSTPHLTPRILSYLYDDKTAVSRELMEIGPDPGSEWRSPRDPRNHRGQPSFCRRWYLQLCILEVASNAYTVIATMTFTDSTGLIAARKAAAPNPLKSKLVKGELAHALSIKIIGSIEIVGYAASAGYDCVLIDLEHSSFGLDTTNQLSCAALQLG